MLRFAPLVLAFSAVAQADIPAGDLVDEAVVVDVLPEGFDALADLVPALLPASIDIPEVHQGDTFEDCFLGICVTWADYYLDVYNGWAAISVNYASIVPDYDTLILDASATVTVNNSVSPLFVDAGAELVGLINLSDECDVWLDPITLDISMPITLEIVDDGSGNTYLDATIPPPTWGSNMSWNASGDKVNLNGCTIADIVNVINDILGFFSFNIFDLVIPVVEDLVETQLADLLPELETTLEDTFNNLSIDQEVPIGESVLEVSLAPNPQGLDITPAGLRLLMDGSAYADEDPCVAQYGVTESLATPGAIPTLGNTPLSVPFDHHAGVFADDDFVNQALFSVWRSGLLCYEVVDDGFLPIGINTTLLGLLAPETYDDLFPQETPEPLKILTRPAAAPIAYFDGGHDIDIEVRELGLDFYAELDGRQMRVIGMDLEANAGINLDWDSTIGELGILVDLTGDDLDATVGFNQLTGDEGSEQVETAIAGLFDTLVGSLLGSLLDDLAFPLPSFEGIGLLDLAVNPAGPNEDWLGVYATVGQVPYQSAGCGCDGNGGGAGCDTGCSATGKVPAQTLLLLPALLLWLRRRRED